MQSAQVLATVARSAWSTLQILDRQAQRDCLKVWRLLTCKQAIQTYRALYRLAQIACMIAIVLGMMTREWMDRFVQECEQSPAPQPEPQPEPVPAPAPLHHEVLPFRLRRPVPAWKSLTGEAKKRALRNACSAAGIQWRAKLPSGKTKYLTIAEMEAALG